jgi:hypothetical protein
MALSLDQREEALESLEAALDAGRRIIGELATGRDSYVRDEPASRSPHVERSSEPEQAGVGGPQP